MALSQSTRVIALLGVAALGLLGPAIAQACGSFFLRERSLEARPSLSREKVLLIHDAANKRQHFIREVAFVHASEPFGFVVPTPTRPEVAEVESSPFPPLRERFGFQPRPRGGRGVGANASGSGTPQVEVLEQTRVGSFTAFVLAATDADALRGWLAKNQLVSDAASDAWLEHYVKLGFYYVAMRYDPPDQGHTAASGAVVAETIRISFATPLPYYPYLEPSHDAALDLASTDPRLLELWYVGEAPVVPVALRERDGERAWVQPLQRGRLHRHAQTLLATTLPPELEPLLPSGPLVVQTFQDQKRVREGFGDVLFAFEQAQALTPERVAELEPLLGLLDPALIPEPESSP